MYQYDAYDQEIVRQRSREFREQVQRRLDGQLSEEAFKPLRLMNGLYLQLHGYMLRVAIPYGVLSAKQLRKLADIADRYDRGYGHFTTRQNIQFNWLQLKDAPDILDELAEVDLHAIQTSGNCIRNITTDALAGVANDEYVDPRAYCEVLRQWSSFHPEFAYLPRKFKLAVIGAREDRAAIRFHDIGLALRNDTNDNVVVDVWLGGGQGRTPKVATLLRESLPVKDLLKYLTAAIRVYNLHGRRDNKYKARIKILLAEMGADKMREAVDTEFASLHESQFPDIDRLLKDVESRLIQPEFHQDDHGAENDQAVSSVRSYRQWVQHNVLAHKVPGYSVAAISLKTVNGVPGDVTSRQMRLLADLAEQYSQRELRVTHRQNLLLPHVPRGDLPAVWEALGGMGLQEANHDQPSNVIACPGLDYCSLATARSIPVAQSLTRSLRVLEQQHDLAGTTINISGCINACAHHHVASIGVLGLNKQGEEYYQLTLGGQSGQVSRVGQKAGPGLSAGEVVPAVERVLRFYAKKRRSGESFADACDRLGKSALTSVIYVEEHADVVV